MGIYYKIARPNGFDFYTGTTINYRAALNNGGLVKPDLAKIAKLDSYQLCSPSVIHASDVAEKCFIGGRVPCSLYRVEGTPVVSDSQKAGFTELRVLEELDPAKHFKWRYEEAVNPVHPLRLAPPKINDEVILLLENWASVWASVRDSVGASVWDSVGDSVRDSVWAYTGYIFAPVVTDWKYIKHEPGEYPFQPAVDLWKMGLVPSYDSKMWRLHGHEDARVLYALSAK